MDREVTPQVVQAAVHDQVAVEAVVVSLALRAGDVLVHLDVVADLVHVLKRVLHSVLLVRVVVERDVCAVTVRF